MTTAKLDDTYVAALQHGLVSFPEGATLVGVVRRPTGWFHAAVDENLPALAPPASLLDRFAERHEDLKLQGMCDEGAHNAAWEDLDFDARYRSHLTGDPEAREAATALAERVAAGERVVLVCFENTDQKRCHRTILRDHLLDLVSEESAD